MELSTVMKKKKRRTRKCLDEIRKRSRLTTNKPSLQHDKHKKTEADVPIHTLITANRLTLNMFPKAICSETITRPLLEELRHKSSYNGEEYQTINKSPIEMYGYDQCQSVASNNSMPLFDLEENSVKGYGSNTSPLMDSQCLLCPTHISQVPAELTGRQLAMSHTSLSSETFDENHGLDLHEELMNSISLHLKTITSINIKEDMLNSIKTDLHKLFTKSKETHQSPMLDSCQLKEINVLSPKTPIVENPINYIRLQQPFRLEEFGTGLSGRYSPLSRSTPESACPSQVKLFDTPEYNYYPHRLN